MAFLESFRTGLTCKNICGISWQCMCHIFADLKQVVHFVIMLRPRQNGRHLVTAIWHYSDVTWASWRLQSPASQMFIPAYIKENNKSRITGPLWRESTVDRWLPSQRASKGGNIPYHDVSMRHVCFRHAFNMEHCSWILYRFYCKDIIKFSNLGPFRKRVLNI